MPYSEIAVNNRLEIILEIEGGDAGSTNSGEKVLKCHRGIVIEIDVYFIILVSELGEILEIMKEDIIYISKISFDRQISSAIMDIKNYYQEKIELEKKLRDLDKLEPQLMEELYDANLLSKFNIFGARNRLNKSIPKSYLDFSRGVYNYNISFSHNPNSEIEITLKASNNITHYNPENVEVDKMIRVHAPDEKLVIEKSFNGLHKVKELERYVEHEKDNIYNVISVYKVNIELTEETFLDKREEICVALNKLKM